jgi:parallel beta-helix repeat protein
VKRTPLWIILAMILVMGWAGSVGAASLPQTTRPSAPKGKPTPTAVVEPTEAPTEDATTTPEAEPTDAPTEEPTEEPTGAPPILPTAESTEEPTEEPTAEPTTTPAGDGRDTTSALARLIQNTLPGGLIELDAETYTLNGPLVIDKSLSIVGAGPDETLIVSEHGDAVIRVESIFIEASISGVSVQYTGEDYANVLVVDNAALNLSDCRLTGGVWDPDITRGGDGLLMWGSAVVTADGCRFEGNGLHGIETKDTADLTVINSVFADNGEDGIAFFGDSIGDVRDNEFANNGLHGIGGQDAPELVIVGNNFHDNAELGMRLADQTQAEVRENIASNNGLHGVALRDDATGVIADNVTNDNVETGIVLFGASSATITGNECNGNGLHGIGLEDQSQGVVENNVCQDNGEDGLVFFTEATGEVRNNEFSGNGLHGIGIGGSGSPTVEDNICSGNLETGMRLSDTTAAVVRRNTCNRNGLHGIQVRDQAAPLLEDNVTSENTEVGVFFSGEATGAAIRTECANNNWGLYIEEGANPWLEDNNCFDNVEADIDDRRPEGAAERAVRPTGIPTGEPTSEPTDEPTSEPTGDAGTTPRPNGDLIFSYDFDGGDQAPVAYFGTETMRYREADGEGQLSSKSEGVVLPAFFDLPPLADFYAEIDLDMPSPGASSGYGLIFRSLEIDDVAGLDAYYLLTLHPDAGDVELALWQNGEWAMQSTAALPEELAVAEGYVRLRVETVGGEFRIWIDDTYITTFEDDALLDAGDFGVSISPDPVAGRDDLVYLDNLSLYAPEGVVVEPVTTPEAPAGVLYQEDFEGDTTDFDVFETENGEVWLEDGELHLLNYSDAEYSTWTYGNQSFADAIIQVDSRLVDGSAENWHQIGCRYVDGENYVIVDFSADGYVFAKAVVDGEDIIALDVGEDAAVNTDPDAVNTIRLECVGDTIRYFLNDQLVVEFEDTQPAAGDIVLGVAGIGGDYSEIAYDNLVVTGPDGTGGGGGGGGRTVTTPTPEPPTGVLFEDDFEGDTTEFDIYEDDNGEVWLEEGELHVLNYTDAEFSTWSFANQRFADAVIEVESRFVDGSDDNWHQILCRYVDSDNYITAEYSADGYVYAKAVVDGEDIVALDVTEESIIETGLDGVNTVRLECVGDTIRYFLNDELLVEFEDTQAVAGDIVLGVSSMDGDYSEIAYDNLVVSGPGAENGGGGEPPVIGDDEAVVTVTAQRLNVREGPGANYAIVTTARQGDQLPAIGRNTDCSWINVETDDGEGWVSMSFVDLNTDCGILSDNTP